jgi:hypothetical protein
MTTQPSRSTIVSVVLAAGCLREPPRPAFDDAAITAACEAEAKASCTVRHACDYGGLSGPDFEVILLFGDDATCQARTALACINALHVTDTGQTTAHVEDCTQGLASETCNEFYDNNPTARCATPMGPGAIGSPCANFAQCASTYCAVPDHQACGTCRPIPEPGVTCEGAADCGHGLICAIPPAAPGGTPINCPPAPTSGTCVAVALTGQACLTGTLPCIDGNTCMKDNTTTGTMGTCMPVAQLGQACDNARQKAPPCNRGLVCISIGSGMTACQPTQFADTGEACGTIGTGSAAIVMDCRGGGLCLKTNRCTATGTCVAPADDGDPCSIDATVGPPCQTPAICVVGADGVSGACEVSDPTVCF